MMRYKLEQVAVLLIYFGVTLAIMVLVVFFVVMFMQFLGIIHHVRIR